jgi:hypothetical protein
MFPGLYQPENRIIFFPEQDYGENTGSSGRKRDVKVLGWRAVYKNPGTALQVNVYQTRRRT